MDVPHRRDINELLVNGYFKNSRARSPSDSTPISTNTHTFLKADHTTPRARSRSREPPRKRGPPPPRPIAEDEVVSLAKEFRVSPTPSYDPPLRGIVDQNPIILEAEVSAAEAARLHAAPLTKENAKGNDDNGERRFVLIPRSDTHSPNHDDEHSNKSRKHTENAGSGKLKEAKGLRPEPTKEKETGRPPIERRRSRQDLPSLQTKVPRELPPQFRRSASAYASTPKDRDETPRASGLGTPAAESFLSPDVQRGHTKDYFGTIPAPRHASPDFAPRSDRSSSQTILDDVEKDNPPVRTVTVAQEARHSIIGELTVAVRTTSPLVTRIIITDAGGIIITIYILRKSIYDRHLDQIDHLLSGLWKGQLREQALDSLLHLLHLSRRPNSRPVSPSGKTQETPRPSDRLRPIDKATPSRPGSRQSTPAPAPTQKHQPIAPPTSLPISIPSKVSLQSPGDSRKIPSFPQYDESKPSSTRPTASSWHPPPFQPPSSNLEKPVGSFRRYSEEIDRGAIAPLPSCPRTTFTRGRNDWLTLPQCPSFDICPSCFNSTIAPTEFRHHFVQAPPRPSSMEVLCDFGSSPWYRIAWLLTLKDRRRDLKLFYGLAHIANTTPPCLGKHDAVRQWHSIIDPKTRAPIQNFDVCYSCVKSIETLLPPIRGIFVRTDGHGSQGLGRVCDLRFDSKRFIQYFDALETTADQADDDDETPDTRSLASLVRRFAMIDECQRDTELVDARWHIITQLPEFTVCEECFDEYVWPELDEGKAIPAMFNKKQQILPRASCQLYSERMRAVFSMAVDGNDYKLLASKARERKTVELAYRANLESMKRQLKSNPQVAGREIERITAEWRKWE
ncbi:hypothetical protein D0Z07_5306 [Hyphodiscus hymeniophilus]|uniref:Uncharacterized protein n=1 Tax=Hyphodiscus hymeniophilus TaxID=353542 RepID=A0A9P7AWX0_9HELO|nr:hypothetical protein D0Z07_5306 [Hyphodiscus hymeniophilus]